MTKKTHDSSCTSVKQLSTNFTLSKHLSTPKLDIYLSLAEMAGLNNLIDNNKYILLGWTCPYCND